MTPANLDSFIRDFPVEITLISFVFGLFLVTSRENFNRILRRAGDERAVQSSHDGEPLRIGGIGIFFGILFGYFMLQRHGLQGVSGALLLSAVPVVAAGLAEDLGFPASPKVRLLATLVSGIAAMALTGYWLPRADIAGLDALLTFAPIAILMTLAFTTVFPHAVNLVDGLHGLSSTVIISSSIGLGLLALKAGEPDIAGFMFVITLAMTGFLLVNWPFGLLFLGDAGSYGLGHLLIWGAVALATQSDVSAMGAGLLVLFWPFADTIHTVLRRIAARKAVFEPDRMHLHQKFRRTLEIVFFGPSNRELSNPIATLALTPFIVAPVIAGVLLWNRPVASYLAWLCFFAGFAGLHLLSTAYAKRSRGTPLVQWPRILGGPGLGLAQGDADGPDEPGLSDYSGIFLRDGLAVDVQIFQSPETSDWRLQTWDGAREPVLWSTRFPTEAAAWDAFIATVNRLSMHAVAGPYKYHRLPVDESLS